MAGGLVAVMLLVVALAFGGALFVLVQAEHDDRQAMDRAAAQRRARRDTDDE